MDESKDLVDTNVQQFSENTTNMMDDQLDSLYRNIQRKSSKKLVKDESEKQCQPEHEPTQHQSGHQQQQQNQYPIPKNISRKSLSQQFDEPQLDQYPGNGKRKLSAKLNIATLRCPLCQQQNVEQQFTTFTLCTHKYCIKCSIKLIKYNMANLKKVLCPLKQCDAPLDSKSSILSYLTSDELEKLNRIENDREYEPYSMREQDEEQYEKQIQISEEQVSRKLSTQQPSRKLQKGQQINEQQIQLTVNISPLKHTTSLSNSAYISQSSQKYPSTSNFTNSEGVLNNQQISQKKQDKLKMSRFVDGNRENQDKITIQSDPIYPYKLFKYLCAQVWLNKWSRFLKLLPISIITLFLLLIFTMLWLIFIVLYFIIIWLVLIPIIWSVYQIWGCFQRSFKTPMIRKILFLICLLGFPLILTFFYFLTLWIVAYDGLYKADIKEIVIGNKSHILNGKKMSFNGKRNNCQCFLGQKCENCDNRRQILCFVL